ncbi:MAG: GNAT family N-acetyltransferase [Nitrospinota bacterium]
MDASRYPTEHYGNTSGVSSPPFKLRPPTLDDVEPYTAFLADPEVTVWLDDFFQRPITRSQVVALFGQEAWCRWAIESEGAFVGLTALVEPDLARGAARFFIVIGERRLWGRGLGTAVLLRVLEHGFHSLGLRKINSDYLEPNEGSRIIHERAGFVVEGCLRQDVWRRGGWVNRILLSILRDEYFDRK